MDKETEKMDFSTGVLYEDTELLSYEVRDGGESE